MKKLTALLLAAVMILSMAACSTQKPAETTAPETKETQASSEATTVPEETEPVDPLAPYDETVTIRIGRMDAAGNKFCNDDTMYDNEYLRYIKKKTNVQVEYEWLAATEDIYKTKVAMSLTAHQIPDVMIVDEEIMLKMADADLLADLTEAYDVYLSDYLKGFYDSDPNHEALKAATVNGKLLGLPQQNAMAGNYNLFWYREDWRQAMNLPEPKTVQDAIAMARAFHNGDPDGNGEKDTGGLLGDKHLWGINAWDSFNILAGSKKAYPGFWLRDDNDKLFYGSVQPETKEALKMLADLYAEGIIDKEFAIGDAAANNSKRMNGQVGCWFCPFWYCWNCGPIIQNNPGSVLRCVMLADDEGVVRSTVNAPAPRFAVVRKGFEHPEALAKIYNVQMACIRGADDEFNQIKADLAKEYNTDNAPNFVYASAGDAVWPININLEYVDAVQQRGCDSIAAQEATGDEKTKLEQAMDATTKIWYDSYAAYANSGDSPETRNIDLWYTAGCCLAAKVLNDTEIENVVSLFHGTTDTMNQVWPTLQKIETETFMKIIMGEAPLDEFDKFVEQWHELGGDLVLEEIDALLGG